MGDLGLGRAAQHRGEERAVRPIDIGPDGGGDPEDREDHDAGEPPFLGQPNPEEPRQPSQSDRRYIEVALREIGAADRVRPQHGEQEGEDEGQGEDDLRGPRPLRTAIASPVIASPAAASPARARGERSGGTGTTASTRGGKGNTRNPRYLASRAPAYPTAPASDEVTR